MNQTFQLKKLILFSFLSAFIFFFSGNAIAHSQTGNDKDGATISNSDVETPYFSALPDYSNVELGTGPLEEPMRRTIGERVPAQREWRAPVQREWERAPAQREWERVPVQREWERAPAQREWERAPAQREWERTPVQREWERAPAQREWERAPAQREWERAPAQREWERTPAQREWERAPAQREWERTPVWKEGEEKLVPKKKPYEEESIFSISEQEVFEEKLSRIERQFAGVMSSTEVSTKLEQFGYDIFQREVSTFAPIRNVPVGPDYIIGPGDSFAISIWGKVEATHSVTVSRDGKIILPEVGVVNVWGLKFSDLKEVLHGEFSKYIPKIQLNITMLDLRTIQVFVVGNVQTPGNYTISPLSTMINALFVCGGPTKEGTLRSIQLIRNGKTVKTLDLYDFLLKGDKSHDERLEQGDTIFVPLVGKVVGCSGNVKRPAIYEMKGELTLGDFLKLAGGATPMGYLQRVQVERILAHEMNIVVDLNLSPTLRGKETAPLKTPLQDRDMVKIYPIMARKNNIVKLEGHVLREGDYELKKGMRIGDLISSFDDLQPEPYIEYGEIIRLEEPDLHELIIPFNLGEVLKKNPKHNLKLQKFDRIRIYSKWHFEYKYKVSIEGEARRPGIYKLLEKMRVSNLVLQAGNLTKEAYPGKAEIYRITPDRETMTIPFNLGKAMAGDEAENILLQDEDRVVVHNIWETKNKETVSVIGETNKSGDFRLTQNMRISDLIFRAGGLKDSAYLKKAELTRNVIDQEGMKSKRFEIDLEKALEGDKASNLLLKKYDTLKVRIIPDWREKRIVTLLGEVRFPGEYTVGKEEKLSSLLMRAGGYTDNAYLRGAVFNRESVKVKQKEQLDKLTASQEIEIQAISAQIAEGTLTSGDLEAAKQTLTIQKDLLNKLQTAEVTGRIVIKLVLLEELPGTDYDIKLKDEDELYIPMQPDTVSILGEVYNPTSIIYREKKTVGFYLNKVGGATDNANDDEIYLIRADGSVVSRSQTGFLGISWDEENNRWTSGGFMKTRIYAGDAILVPRDLEKIQWLKTTSQVTKILYEIAIAAGVATLLF